MKLGKELTALIFWGLSGGYAHAANSASANAVLDWSSFTVTGSGQNAGSPAPSVIWSNQGTKFDVYTFLPNNVQHGVTNDWTSLINGTSGNTVTNAKITDSAASLQGYAYDANLNTPGTGAAVTTLFSGDFTAVGNGVLDFTVNYSLAADYSPTPNDGFSKAEVFLTAQQSAPGTVFPLNSSLDVLYLDNNTANLSPLAKGGILDLKLSVTDGQVYKFQAENLVSVAASVPLPAAAWFFLSGMIAFLGLARRK